MTAQLLDIALYQVPGAFARDMTIPANSKPPNFGVAGQQGVDGVIARTTNDVRVDPSFQLFIPAVKLAGLETCGYGFARPWLGGAIAHCDAASTAMAAVSGTSLGWMLDLETPTDGVWPTKGTELRDFVLTVVTTMRSRWGKVAGYFADWWLTQMAPGLEAEIAAAFDFYIRPAYPHQPFGKPVPAYPPVHADGWLDWARTTQPPGPGGDPGIPDWPPVPPGRPRKREGWQMSSLGDRNDYGWPDPAPPGLDLNVVTDEAWADWKTPIKPPEVPVVIPRFANGYDGTLPNGQPVEQGLGAMVTFPELLKLSTVRGANREALRRTAGVWLFAYDNGQPAGPGTFYRTPAQQGQTPGGAPVWASWHMGESPSADPGSGAMACDNVPASFQHWWAARQAYIAQTFGLVIYKTSSDPAAWNHSGVSYAETSTQEYWHSELWECDYGRGRPATKPGNFPLAASKIRHWALPAKYDIDVVGVEFWNHPLWTGDETAPIPPQPQPDYPVYDTTPTEEDDDMKFAGYYQLAGQVGIFAHYHTTGRIGVKVQMNDLDMWASHARTLMREGVPIPDQPGFGMITTPDINGFRALGPVLGLIPGGCDAFGVALP